MKKEDINFTVLGKLADLVLKIQAVECEQDIRVRVELATNKLLEDVARIAWENLRGPVSDEGEPDEAKIDRVVGVVFNSRGKVYEYRTDLDVKFEDDVLVPVKNGRCIRGEVVSCVDADLWTPREKKLEELAWVEEVL